MPKGVYKKTKEHIAKVVGNLQPGWNKELKGVGAVGEKNGNWIGDKIGYYGIHSWLKNYFGKATKCQQCGSIKNIVWAKLKGKKYQRKRENFWMLCAKCHVHYDKIGFKKGIAQAKGNTFRRINKVGQRFGKLSVILLVGKNKWGNLMFLCKCDCGREKVIPSGNLTNNGTKSCGCIAQSLRIGNKFRQGIAPWNKGLKIKF